MSQQVIETTLRVTAYDEATAVHVAEVLARVSVSLSAERVLLVTDTQRYVQDVCDHRHEVEP